MDIPGSKQSTDWFPNSTLEVLLSPSRQIHDWQLKVGHDLGVSEAFQFFTSQSYHVKQNLKMMSNRSHSLKRTLPLLPPVLGLTQGGNKFQGGKTKTGSRDGVVGTVTRLRTGRSRVQFPAVVRDYSIPPTPPKNNKSKHISRT